MTGSGANPESSGKLEASVWILDTRASRGFRNDDGEDTAVAVDALAPPVFALARRARRGPVSRRG